MDDVPSELIGELKRGGLTYDDMEDQFGFSRDQSRRRLRQMREAGYALEFDTIDDNGTRLWYLEDKRDKRFTIGEDGGTYRFGVISDTHLGSQAEHLEDLNHFYDTLQERGISTVFHAGDISDGYEVYRHHVNELKADAIGWQRLKHYVVDNYPYRDGITTHFITGNHDYKFYKRNGLHFGKLIDDRRDDLNWLGEMQATIVFEDDIDMELIHPSGGQPYSIGYRAQTLYRERPPNDRPSLGIIGHLHGKLHADVEGVEVFYPGAWQGMTTYLKRKGKMSKIGGWIIEIEIENGIIRRISTDWQGYRSKDYDNEHDMEDLEELSSGQ